MYCIYIANVPQLISSTDSIEELKQHIASLTQSLNELKKISEEQKNQITSHIQNNNKLKQTNEEQKNRITYLEKLLIDFKNDKFGSKSEKLDPNDHLYGRLFNEAELGINAPDSLYEGHSETEHISSYSRKKSGRRPLPDNIPREEFFYDISDSEKICSCGNELKKIGEEISEQLFWVSAAVIVHRHIRRKYACEKCKGDERNEAGKIVVTAPAPAQLLPKSILTPEFFTYILISKFLDHIPFYRMEKILLRYRIEVTRATFSNWIIEVYERYRHLFEFLKELLLEGRLLGIDETTLQVHNEKGRKDTQKSYMWILRGGTPDRPVLKYIYRESRSAEFLRGYLEGYSGIIQTDGYASYDTHFTDNESIIHIACMAHIRREFAKIWKSDKDPYAGEVLVQIRKVYFIEKEIRNLELHKNQNYAEIVRIRNERSKPILDFLHELLKSYALKYPPKTSMGKAARYALGQWDKMKLYLSQGESYIDNNLVENAVRPFVLGRKNWLFSGCPEGADASAFWYSLIQTVKANNKEPYAVLLAILKKLPLCQNTHDCKTIFFEAMGWS